MIEYEDQFPYSEEIIIRRPPESWSRVDVDRLLAFCRGNSLGVIPLVQTAGHLEYLLKHPSRDSIGSNLPLHLS